MNIKKAGLLLWATIITHCSFGQGYNISGTLQDETDNSALIGVSVVVNAANDTSVKTGAITDIDGHFTISGLTEGSYHLKASYIGFEPYERNITLTRDIALGILKMKVSNAQLKNVTIEGQQVRVQQSGDTTNYNAGAYKTNPDATAEDLLTKMPGITTDGGTVKANGEDVKQVLVDGKPFFGDDPNATIKNLPAEIIDKIQVFDKLSDQAQLTGFDDGQSQKTINIITKPGKNNGQFGKIYGGYGSKNEQLKDNFYLAGGNINFFNGDRRISIIALSNNINQQNFSTDDLLGVTSTSSGQGRGGGGYRGRSGGSRGGGGYGGSAASNFLVGQQDGITTTNSAGINYSDSWGKKIKVSGSYFFNNTENTNNNNLTRNYFTAADSNLVYKENSNTVTKNTNHRANLRLEYNIDSSNMILFTPRISFQQNSYDRTLSGSSTLPDSTEVNNTNNRNSTDNNGYNFSSSLLYQHKFAKKGRTISLNLNAQSNNRIGSGSNYALNQYVSDTGYLSTLLDQHYDLTGNGYTFGGSLNYTEPLGRKSQLMISYAPSYNKNISDKETKNNNGAGEYTDLDTSLSNKYDNTYLTQRGGIHYRYSSQKLNFFAGLNYQYATLDGAQDFPYDFHLEKTFSSVLPQAMLNLRFSRNENLRIMYRTNTDAPSISQLQNVIDNSNALLLKTGNPELKQDYTHTLIFRYGNTNTQRASNFFAFAYANIAQNYISNQNFTDSSIAAQYGFTLLPGSQLSRPVNLDGYYSIRTFLTYGMPVKLIKSNLNLSAGFTFSHTPGLINLETNYANNYALNGGVVISSNISENVDFTLAYSGNYNIVKNTLQTQSDNNYYSQTTSLKLNYIFLKGFVFNTSLNHSLYSGLSQGFNQEFLLWNASLGYKFFKDRSLDVRLTAYDILNQNRAITRTVTETYIEDNYTNVLQRYFMLNVTYTLRNFGSAAPKGDDPRELFDMRPPQGGERRQHGGPSPMD